MKKKVLVTAIVTLTIGAVGVTACSKKVDTPAAATTEAASEIVAECDLAAEAEAETAENAEENETTEDTDLEEIYMSGLITAMNGDILTVKNDEDSTEKDYDISNADVTQEYPFSEGDWIEICYAADPSADPIPALTVEVLDSVIAQNTDPTVEGMIIDAANENITIQVDGEDYTLIRANAYVVGKSGILVDKNAQITYIGDLDDEALAVKIVMEDSYDSDAAQINALIGEVAQIGEDGESIILKSAQEDFFTFVSDDIDFTEYDEGDLLQIEYTGTITAKEIPAVEVTKR